MNTNILPQIPGFSWHVQSVSVSCLASPSGTLKLTLTDGFSVWEQYIDRDPSGNRTVHPNHWPFPDGGLSFLVGAQVSATLSADATTTKLALQAANRVYGP